MTLWETHPLWREDDLFFDFSAAMQVIKLDEEARGLTHLLKGGVDFVVEWSNQLWLVEVKDPDSGDIPEQHRDQQQKNFLHTLLSNELIEKHLFPKLRDSLIILGMDRGIAEKPLKYITVIGLSTLEPAQLNGLKERLWKTEWLAGAKRGWNKSFEVHVMNVGQWNRSLTQCPITRISEQH
ncbi:hypothetical protein [Pseudomonas sp. LB3P25]